MSRWIMHLDMDAFFAAVEQLDHPELRGKPVLVGGGGLRGVVSTASYEVRTFGVHSGMSLVKARQLCPQAILVPVRMDRYVAVSRQIMEVLRGFSPLVEQASVDEAYLDATGLERLFGPVEGLAARIKQQVREATGGLHCSVGLAPVKFLAKISSEERKPDGLFILYPEQVEAFLRTLPVERIPGVGKQMRAALQPLNVRTCADVLRYPQHFWQTRFGKSGAQLFARAEGRDERQVEPFSPPKSESAETTFSRDTRDTAFLKHWLYRHADRVGRALRRQRLQGKVVTLKVKYADFTTLSRQTSLATPTCATDTLYEAACALLDALTLTQPVRLIGLGVSGFDAGREQQLFLPFGTKTQDCDDRRKRLDQTLDQLNDRFGRDAIIRGRLFVPPKKE